MPAPLPRPAPVDPTPAAIPPAELWSAGLFTVAETAAFLACSRDTVERLMRSGSLPWVKVRRAVRVSKSAVVRYLEQQRRDKSAT